MLTWIGPWRKLIPTLKDDVEEFHIHIDKVTSDMGGIVKELETAEDLEFLNELLQYQDRASSKEDWVL